MFSGKLKPLRLGFLLPAFGLLLVGLLWIAVAVRQADERLEVLQLNTATAASYVKVFRERTNRVLLQADQNVEFVRFLVNEGTDTATLDRLVRTRQVLQHEAVVRVMVLDAQGGVIAGDTSFDGSNHFDRELLVQPIQGASAGLMVGKPVRDRTSGRWIIPATGRLNLSDGSFAGAVVVAIDASFLTGIYDPAALGKHGSMTLVGTDGVVRAQRVGDAILHDQPSAADAFYGGDAKQIEGTSVRNSPLDGVRRIFSYQRLSAYPLIAVVGIDEDEALAGLKPVGEESIYFGAIASFVILGFIALMLLLNRDLERSRRRVGTLAATLDASGDYVVTAYADGTVIYANPAARRLLGGSRTDTANLYQIFPPWARLRLADEAATIAQRDGHWLGETAILQGMLEIPLSHMLIAHRGPDGELAYYSNIMRDISDAKRNERALRNSEERLRRVTDRLPMRIAYIDAQERFQLSNLEYEREFGLDAASIKGRSMRELLGDSVYDQIEPYIRRALQGETVTFDQERGSRSGYYCSRATFIPDLGDDGSVLGFHSIQQDVTAIKLEEQRLRNLSEIDSLSGLANRSGFERILGEAMVRTKASHALIAVMYLDIDYFKRINDTFGHAVGDALLRDFGKRLCNCVRGFDTVARFGGDEFTILLQDLPSADAAVNIATKIIASMSHPFMEEQNTLSITASIGIALYRGGATTAKELIGTADAMLYAAKTGGRNRYCIAPELTGERVEGKGSSAGRGTVTPVDDAQDQA